jgi:Zn-dependent protease/CBS domain-containing protein
MASSSSSHLQTGWAFRIATVAGIPIRIHFTFVLILLYVGFLSSNQGHAVVAALAGLLMVFVCVVLHELGHALVARRFGVETLEIVLYPIGGVARLKSLPSGKAELLIAIAGPAVNLLIVVLVLSVAVFLLGLAWLQGEMFLLQVPKDSLVFLLQVNVMLLLFNLIPAFPMDGGRILRSTLTLLGMPEDRATGIAAGIGQAIAVVFAIVGLVSTQPFLVLIALFVFLGAGQEAAFVQRRLLVRGRTAREAMITRLDTLAPQDSLRRAAEMLLDSHQHDFPVVDAWGRVVGLLSRSAILEGLAKPEPGGAVLEIMDRNLCSVAPESPMEEVLRRFQESGGKPLLVMEGDGLVGMLTLDKLAEFIEIARRSPTPAVEER